MSKRENYRVLESLIKSSKKLRDDLTDIFKQYDLGIVEFGLLEALYTLGSQPIQILAKRILVTSGSMTYTVNLLLDKGYIERKNYDLDRRIFYLSLTEKGERLIEKVIKVHDDYLENFLKKLDLDERKVVAKLLTKLYRE